MLKRPQKVYRVTVILVILVVAVSAYFLLWKTPPSQSHSMSYSSLTSPDHEIAEASKTSEKSRPNIGNPAAAYCKALGYQYEVRNGIGYCILPDGDSCEEWSFYAGKCGREYSYCIQNGYGLETRSDGKDPYAREYSACILPNGTAKPASRLMNLSGYLSARAVAPTRVPQLCMSNPAAAYCIALGYEYRLDGETGYCIFPDGSMCEEWSFYAGECGQKYSYCAKHGYKLEPRDDGKDPYARKYSACILPDKSRKPASILMKLDQFIYKTSCNLKLSKKQDIEDAQSIKFGKRGQRLAGATILTAQVPPSFDWRNVNGSDWTTPVKNQGQCGSCWAFSAVGTVEAIFNIAASNPDLDPDLSEENLVSDCFVGHSCCGGWHGSALNYIEESGIVDEACFPYVDTWCQCWGSGSCQCTYSGQGVCSDATCSDRCSDWANRLWQITHYDPVLADPDVIKSYLTYYGPLSAAMAIDSEGYWDGDIYRCVNDDDVNHAVVIVGYDDEGGYWIVRNSWGPTWNGDGHFKVGYGECSIEEYVYYATARPEPPLYGFVIDVESEMPISGAVVQAIDLSTGAILGENETDSSGYYEISDLEYDIEIYLVVSVSGYYTYRSEAFELSGPTRKDIALTPTDYLSGTDVLLVLDNDADYHVGMGVWPDEILTAIESAGYSAKEWNELAQGRPLLEALQAVRAVFWHTGTVWSEAVSELDSQTLIGFVSNGGRLILEGEDIGFDHGSDEFMLTVAHATFQVDSAAGNLTVSTDHPVVSGLPEEIDFESPPPYPDGVSPTPEATEVMAYESGYSAIVVYEGQNAPKAKVVYIAFPLHYLSEDIRNTLIKNALNWVIENPLYLVVRGLNDRIYYNVLEDDDWSGWIKLPTGSTPDTPAAVACGGRLHFVVRGFSPSNSIWYGYINLSTGDFSGWIRIPGATPSKPELAADLNCNLYLAVRGMDDGIWINSYNGSTWTGWRRIQGSTVDGPAIAILGNTLHMIVRGSDGFSIWHSTMDLTSSTWQGWTKISGSTPSTPDLAVDQTTSTLYLAVRGTDSRIYIRSWFNGSWGNWERVPSGTTPDGPAIKASDQELHILVRGTSPTNSMYHCKKDLSIGTWTTWNRINGATPSRPEVT